MNNERVRTTADVQSYCNNFDTNRGESYLEWGRGVHDSRQNDAPSLSLNWSAPLRLFLSRILQTLPGHPLVQL